MREERRAEPRRGIPLRAVVPNAVTALALCVGLTQRSLRHRRGMGQGDLRDRRGRRARRHGRPHRAHAARPDAVRRRARFLVGRDRLRRGPGDRPASLVAAPPAALRLALRARLCGLHGAAARPLQRQYRRRGAAAQIGRLPHRRSGAGRGGAAAAAHLSVAGQRPAMDLARRLPPGRALGRLGGLPGHFERRHFLLGLAEAAPQRPARGDRHHRPDRRRAGLRALAYAERSRLALPRA